MKCKSAIVREFKTRKAECVWPNYDKYSQYTICGGDVTITIAIKQEPYYGGVDYRLEVAAVCSRCRMPYVEQYEEFRHKVAMEQKLDVTKLLEELQ